MQADQDQLGHRLAEAFDGSRASNRTHIDAWINGQHESAATDQSA